MSFVFVVMSIFVGLTLLWVIWTIRLAVRARRGPTLSLGAFIKHDAAAGGLGRFAGIATLLAASYFFPAHPLQVWVGALAAVIMVGLCETRWPGPSGPLRSAALVARRPRDLPRDLVPMFGGILAAIGLLAAVAVVGFCWIRGDSPGGRKISQNVRGVDGAPDYVKTTGDFPGWPIGLIAAAGFLLVIVAAIVVIRAIASRAALPGLEPSMDLLFRRAAVDRLLRTLAVLGLMTAAEFYTSAQSAFGNLYRAANPALQMPDAPFSWIPSACFVLTVVSMEFARVRPPRRVKMLTSA